MNKFTWDDLFRRAEDQPCLSPELKAKDNARWVFECAMEDCGLNIGPFESVEDHIDDITEKCGPIFFDENGNLFGNAEEQDEVYARICEYIKKEYA